MVITGCLVMIAFQVAASGEASDVNSRRQNAQAVEKAAAKNATDDLVPQIEAGLKDEDAVVRLTATNALLRFAQGRARIHGKPLTVPGDTAALSPSVVRALGDVDPRVRATAASALPFVVSVENVAMAKILAARYEVETDSSVRVMLVFELARRTSTGRAARDAIVRALGDTHARVRQQAAIGVAQFRPPEALPVIAAELRSGVVETREAFVHALASYGSAAIQHVAILESLLATETSRERQLQLTKALETIRQGR
jgi:HEAT repeat protein